MEERWRSLLTKEHGTNCQIWQWQNNDLWIFSAKGVGKISVIDGKMNAQKYKQILQENSCLLLSLDLPSDYIFQQDDPKHTTKSTKKWLSENNVNVSQWQSQCPDWNPIENL